MKYFKVCWSLPKKIDSNFKQTNHDVQAGLVASSGSAELIKEAPRTVHYTQKQIVAFGGIQEEARREVWSSGRLRSQPNADMKQMERAMLIVKNRVETPVIGMSTLKPTSIVSFPEEHIIDNAMSLGVSLGVSHSDCIKSAKLIKEYELQRSLTMLYCKDQSEKNFDNASGCLAVSRASNLCDDLEAEETFMDDADVQIPKIDTRERKQRKKKSYDKKNVRRSNQIRIKPSKLQ
jgi:hypothetical protein